MPLADFLKQQKRSKIWIVTLIILAATFLAANFAYPVYWNNTAEKINDKVGLFNVPRISDKGYSLGLDLRGGIHLVYDIDLSDIDDVDVDDAVSALEHSMERRVNFLGVAEPVVQTLGHGREQRLIIELAGVEDPDEAIRLIGETPFLEFKEQRSAEERKAILSQILPEEAGEGISDDQVSEICNSPGSQNLDVIKQIAGEDPCFASTGLTGRYLSRANVVTDPNTGALQIGLQFDSEGSDLFEDITARNIGSPVAIYLDEVLVSMPNVNQRISGGSAVITGNFSVEEARDLVQNLNAGALPVPIELVNQQRVSASLGAESLRDSLMAAAIAIITVLLFLLIVYRVSGFAAVVSLAVYLSFLLLVIKFLPVTLTLAGIAGLILSLGMAVDANVLIFERLKEELREVENVSLAIDRAFDRAWPSIRDGNFSTILTAVILFLFSTSFVKGFALTLGLGLTISLFSSMVATRFIMKSFLVGKLSEWKVVWTR